MALTINPAVSGSGRRHFLHSMAFFSGVFIGAIFALVAVVAFAHGYVAGAASQPTRRTVSRDRRLDWRRAARVGRLLPGNDGEELHDGSGNHDALSASRVDAAELVRRPYRHREDVDPDVSDPARDGPSSVHQP